MKKVSQEAGAAREGGVAGGGASEGGVAAGGARIVGVAAAKPSQLHVTTHSLEPEVRQVCVHIIGQGSSPE